MCTRSAREEPISLIGFFPLAIFILFVVTIASNDSSSLSFYNFSVIDNNGHQQTLMTLYRTKSCIDLSLNGSDIISTQHCFSYSVDDIESSRFLSKKVDVKSDLDKFSRLLLAGIFVYSLAPLANCFLCGCCEIYTQTNPQTVAGITSICFSLGQFATASMLTVGYVSMKNTILPGILENQNELFQDAINTHIIKRIEYHEMSGFKCVFALMIMLWISAPFTCISGVCSVICPAKYQTPPSSTQRRGVPV